MGGFDARSWDGMVLKGGESEELEIGGRAVGGANGLQVPFIIYCTKRLRRTL